MPKTNFKSLPTALITCLVWSAFAKLRPRKMTKLKRLITEIQILKSTIPVH